MGELPCEITKFRNSIRTLIIVYSLDNDSHILVCELLKKSTVVCCCYVSMSPNGIMSWKRSSLDSLPKIIKELLCQYRTGLNLLEISLFAMA